MSPRGWSFVAFFAAVAAAVALAWAGIRPPDWVFPLAVVVLLGFYVNGVTEQVPLYLSNRRTQQAVADLTPDVAGARIVDLGCGFGGVVLAVARARPGADVLGVETAPLSWLISLLRVRLSGLANARIEFRGIWNTDLGDVDFVYAFLSPAPMARLYAKVRAEMKPGTVFVSNSFEVPDEDPDEVLELDDRRRTRLLVWRM